MLEENAVVVELDGEYAWIETQRKTACGSCSVNKGCGTSVISKVVGNRRTRVRALNQAHAVVGDHVVVGVQQNALVRGSLAVYLLPLLGMFLFALLGAVLSSLQGWEYTEGWRIIFSMIGLALGFIMLYRFSNRVAGNPAYQAVVLRRQESPVRFVPSIKN